MPVLHPTQESILQVKALLAAASITDLIVCCIICLWTVIGVWRGTQASSARSIQLQVTPRELHTLRLRQYLLYNIMSSYLGLEESREKDLLSRRRHESRQCLDDILSRIVNDIENTVDEDDDDSEKQPQSQPQRGKRVSAPKRMANPYRFVCFH
jgi:hypothetical protein